MNESSFVFINIDLLNTILQISKVQHEGGYHPSQVVETARPAGMSNTNETKREMKVSFTTEKENLNLRILRSPTAFVI